MESAAREGDADLVVSLARSNPFMPPSIESALLIACEYGHLAVVHACINTLQCNPNCVDKLGRSPLHMAVLRKGNGKIAISILRFLVERGALIRKSVLHVCANDFAIFPLIELKANVNAKSVDGLTPLAVAVAADRQDVVSELLRAGAERSEELLFKAKSPSVVFDLVRYKANVNGKDIHGKTPLHYAVLANDKALARALLESKADPALASQTSCVDLLTSARAKLNDLSVIELEQVETLVNEIQRIVSDMKNKSNNSLCTICKTEQKSILLMPCRHFCVCELCSNVLRSTCTTPSSSHTPSPTIASTCPICRTPIADYVSIYM